MKNPSLIQRAINAVWYATHPPAPGLETVAVDDLTPWGYAGQRAQDPYEDSLFDGGKFTGGFGPTQLQQTDYWTLRARSTQLFNENLYAKGLVRRLVTNEINTGLTPEAAPDEEILGVEEDSLNDWTERVESRFMLWGRSKEACDWRREETFGAIQRAARMEALISGDVLVVLRQDPRTRRPAVQLVSGAAVQTPFTNAKLRKGHEVKHGVEYNAMGRVVAYHIRQADSTYQRLPARGAKSGRRLAWLVFGTEKRLDDVRGQPLLSIVLQSLKEIDRYRDSVQRKAVVNSILAMFVKKTADKVGSLPMQGGAVKQGTATVSGTTSAPARKFNLTKYLPGTIVEELQEGEEPVFKGGEGTDTNFGTFEEAIIQAVAWANEVPPEILRLAFSNNYSASQAAINEFKIYLNKVWGQWGDDFCAPIYVEWLISEALDGKVDAPGLLEAYRDPSKFDTLAAWVMCDWYGSIKPSTDMFKQVKGSDLLVNGAYSTRAREARVTTGTKFSKNVKRLKRENEQLAEALEPLRAAMAPDVNAPEGAPPPDIDAMRDTLVSALEESGHSEEFVQGFLEALDDAT